MTRSVVEKVMLFGGVAFATLAAIGTFFADDDVELTLLMVAAVISGLICFDTSMERQVRGFAPWSVLSLAPILKTAPLVWFTLYEDNGLWRERYEHVGSLLFGAAVLVAVLLLTRPSATSRGRVWFDPFVLVAVAAVGGLAGSSVAFLLQRDFGSELAARLIETPTWGVAATLLAATAIAASRQWALSGAATSLLIVAAATSAALSFSVAGADLDLGWWTLLFAGLAWSAVGFGRGYLGERAERTRRSNTPALVAMGAGVIAAAAAMAARSDRLVWPPAWGILGVLSLLLFGAATAVLIRDYDAAHADDALSGDSDPSGAQVSPVDHGHSGQVPAADSALANVEAVAAANAQAKASALQALRSASASKPVERPIQPSLTETERHQSSSGAAMRPAHDEPDLPRVAAEVSAGEPAANAVVVSADALQAEPVGVAMAATPDEVEPSDPGAAPRTSEPAPMPAVAAGSSERPGPGSTTPLQPIVHAPLAHHIDPSTGLLSAAGLQDLLAQLFAHAPEPAGVTVMMLSVRGIDDIEMAHGRLASARVTREVSSRLRRLVPEGSAARFARAGYAVVFAGDQGPVADITQRYARVMVALRAPLDDVPELGVIDVVAGMAQNYQGETATKFVQRANKGLAKAVNAAEPTFVAMP